jgi:hypothetical protein
MKITTAQLKKIILEELNETLQGTTEVFLVTTEGRGRVVGIYSSQDQALAAVEEARKEEYSDYEVEAYPLNATNSNPRWVEVQE